VTSDAGLTTVLHIVVTERRSSFFDLMVACFNNPTPDNGEIKKITAVAF
jgi:hypothetical protein